MKYLQSAFLVAVLAIMGNAQTAGAQEQVNGGQQQLPPGAIPGVRYTTGSVTTAGWEKVLTENDPNLGRWNWSAMTSYTQSSYGKVPAGAYLKNQRPAGGVYVKPVHINPEMYAKPRSTAPVQIARRMTSSADLSGRLSYKKPAPLQAAAPVIAKSYNIDYSNCSGKLMTSGSSSPGSKASVYGKLMTAVN